MERFPKPCDVGTLFLRVSHGADADRDTRWGKY